MSSVVTRARRRSRFGLLPFVTGHLYRVWRDGRELFRFNADLNVDVCSDPSGVRPRRVRALWCPRARPVRLFSFSRCTFGASAHAQCEVTGVATIEGLRVRIQGERLRDFSVVDLPVAIRPGRGGRYRDIRVVAPLSFSARTDAVLPWSFRNLGLQAAGMIFATPEVRIVSVHERMSRERLRGERLGTPVDVGPEDAHLVLRVQLTEHVFIDRVHVPCQSITVGPGEGSPAVPAWTRMPGPRWELARRQAFMSYEPHRGPSFRIDAPEGLSDLVELGRHRDSVLVRATFASGTAIRGWMRQTDSSPDALGVPATATLAAAFARNQLHGLSPARRPPQRVCRPGARLVGHARPDSRRERDRVGDDLRACARHDLLADRRGVGADRSRPRAARRRTLPGRRAGRVDPEDCGDPPGGDQHELIARRRVKTVTPSAARARPPWRRTPH